MQNDSFSLKVFQGCIVLQVDLVCIAVETDTKSTWNWQNPWRAEDRASEQISQIKIKAGSNKTRGNFLDGIDNLQWIIPPLIAKKILGFSGYQNESPLSLPKWIVSTGLKKRFHRILGFNQSSFCFKLNYISKAIRIWFLFFLNNKVLCKYISVS